MDQARRRTAPLATRRDGFTLVELLIVVVLVGLMASIAAPNIDRVDFQVRAASREVSTRLAAAKHMAVLRQHDVILAFDVTNRQIRVHTDSDNDRAIDAGEDVRTYELPSGIAFGRGGAAALGGVTSTHNLTQTQGSFPSLTFHRNGSASQEGRFYMTSIRASLSNSFATDARVFDIGRGTGLIQCRSYETGSWVTGC